MFRSVSGEGNISGEQRSSSPAGRAVTSPGLDSQESSWIGLLSRPAMAFLQRYLPGRPRGPAQAERGAGWVSGGLKNSFVEEESEFLRQLDDMMPLPEHSAPHLTYLQCQHDGASGLLEHRAGSTLPWLTADSLREIGIQNPEEMDLNICQQTQIGYLSSVRTFFTHVLLSSVSSQEMKPKDWEQVKGSGGQSRRWWGSFLGGEEGPQDVSWTGAVPSTDWLCPQQLETKASETTTVFVQRDRGWRPGENTRQGDHKEEPAHNGGLEPVQNIGSGAATACSEVAFLSPDQDNGYSSLEEEHFQVKVLEDQLLLQESEAAGNTAAAEMEEEPSEEGESSSGKDEEEEEQEVVLSTPQCQNKNIAFIMGCPCSDEDSSQSEGESSDSADDDDDDDGFDSEGSSDLSDSDSEDEDEEDDDEASDSEAERLWSSLCQSVDPYNPRNFTARLRTVSTPPRTIPTSTPPSSAQSTPASSPDLALPPPSSLAASPPLASSSPPSGSDTWDDSTSASEVDEAESLRLWSSFSSSSDPYSPFNFQGPLRTRGPAEAGPRTRTRAKKGSQAAPRSPRHHPAPPPEYRKEEAEERLDSGFSEPSTSSGCSSTKKVRFSDHVEEFFASCGEEDEDRRGPWEELARDRCRFLRRCQEVEESIAYVLQPQHRRLAYRRLVQDA